MKQKEKLLIDTLHPPNVLLLGNGLLRLMGGGCWDQLLESLRDNDWKVDDLKSIPPAMKPECLYDKEKEFWRPSPGDGSGCHRQRAEADGGISKEYESPRGAELSGVICAGNIS